MLKSTGALDTAIFVDANFIWVVIFAVDCPSARIESGVDVTSIQIPSNLTSCMEDIDPVVAVIFAITSPAPASPVKDTTALPDASVVAVGVMLPTVVVN